MWGVRRFNLVRPSSAFCQRRSLDGKHSRCVPTVLGHQADESTGSHHTTTGHTHIVLIAAEAAAQEHTVSVSLVSLRTQLLGHGPEDPFPKLTETIAPLFPMKAAIGSLAISSEHAGVQKVSRMFNGPVSQWARHCGRVIVRGIFEWDWRAAIQVRT